MAENEKSSSPGAVARVAFSVARDAFSAFRRHNMTSVAAALAYYAFLSVPAGLLVAVGTFGLLAGPNAVNLVVDKLHGVVPAQAATLVDDSLHRLVENKGTGLTVLLIGLLVALWSLTGAMQNVMWGVGIAHGCPDRRGFVKKRLVAVAMIAFALIGFAVTFGVLVLGPALSTWIGRATHEEGLVKTAWYIAEWPLALVGLLVAFAGLLAFAPDRRDTDRRAVSYGVVVATVLWVIASALFSVYLSGFASYNKTWGSLAAVVIMLTWLWLGGVALLFGAEVDAELERRRGLEHPGDEKGKMGRLRHVSRTEPGLARRRSGSGFVYRDEDGARVSDPAVLARIRELAIPPAWTDVWICRDDNGHLQAVGTDAAGRRQYLYHERWRRRRDRRSSTRCSRSRPGCPGSGGRSTGSCAGRSFPASASSHLRWACSTTGSSGSAARSTPRATGTTVSRRSSARMSSSTATAFCSSTTSARAASVTVARSSTGASATWARS